MKDLTPLLAKLFKHNLSSVRFIVVDPLYLTSFVLRTRYPTYLIQIKGVVEVDQAFSHRPSCLRVITALSSTTMQ